MPRVGIDDQHAHPPMLILADDHTDTVTNQQTGKPSPTSLSEQLPVRDMDWTALPLRICRHEASWYWKL
ncbi:hypothetical protein [Agrococcus sp. DT81.2]|uniref:hypothetical protein n=1 Tax=Agrococcus sp. DT81.2 TaxID=3393414 RepID=UPI003CE56308